MESKETNCTSLASQLDESETGDIITGEELEKTGVVFIDQKKNTERQYELHLEDYPSPPLTREFPEFPPHTKDGKKIRIRAGESKIPTGKNPELKN